MGRGEYMSIPQDGGKIVVIETPYDREIIELQGRINRTVVPYGSQTQQRTTRGRLEGYVAESPAVASDMAGYMSKRAASPDASPKQSPATATWSATSPADGNRCRRCRSRSCPTICAACRRPSGRRMSIGR
jgi:hypothetical protein